MRRIRGSKMRRSWLLFSQAVTVALALLFVVATLKPEWLRRSPVPALAALRARPTPAVSVASDADRNLSDRAGFSQAARRASPAVVSIGASKTSQRNPHADDPRFRFFFGDPSADARQVGLGSGVIVSADGYLLTNNHVVEGADEIEVRLADGRAAAATVVGTDGDTDLALLKIDLPDLPAVVLGDSQSLQVGDAVLAIGNPFNVGQTVTAGIVSALGRKGLGLSTFENFIQTDAAINPGNSGGALVDAAGRLVGLNTAIFSRSGGSLGIGFAIPVATARQVMDALVRDGRVSRGWIGVEPRDLTPEIAERFGLPVEAGVLIAGVLQSGPAHKGGLRPGDVVVKIGGEPVQNTAQLMAAVAALKPDSAAVLRVQRGDKALDLKLDIGQRPAAARDERPVR
jgi:serine protease DegQ